MPTLVELRQEKGEVWDKAKKINDKAKSEKRKFTAEEQAEWDAYESDIDRLDAQIKRDEKAERRDAELKETRGDSGARPNTETAKVVPLAERVPKEFRAIVEMAGGDTSDPDAQRRARLLEALAHPAYPALFRTYLRAGRQQFDRAIDNLPKEQRADTLQADVFAKGGALVPPLEFIARLIKGIDDDVFMRQWATRFFVPQAEGVGVPTLEADIADADWTTELGTGNEGTMEFGRRELRPHPLAKRIKVSKKLLRSAAAVSVGTGAPVGIEELVRMRLTYKFGITAEKAYMTGDGVGKPLGVFTAHADGIPTSRDVSAGNTTTSITGDGLIEAKYSIRASYWPRLRAILSRTALKQIRLLKDGSGAYLWQPGLQAGQPDRIFDTPYVVSEYAPSTFTTGLYVGIIGDFSNYWIVDALDMTIQSLIELYAETNQVGFIGRLETDGAPVLAEAFARIKLA
jgi:HK97 family phage major capsid protein